jgi:hypothetical protein
MEGLPTMGMEMVMDTGGTFVLCMSKSTLCVIDAMDL